MINSDGTITLSTNVDTSGISKGMAKMSKAVTVGLTAAAAGVAYLTKKSVEAYAEYEQLVGGVDTLFGKATKRVQQYANEAYKTAGLSANQYMQQATSFSASLISSLNGDVMKAADVTNQAMIDMADNANKMGTPLESIQNAYQGFAKQNYTMLDNLKLGYGGTKTEMQRLLADAEKIAGVKYDISNLSDVYNAIHVIQEQLHITGTTAKEAEATISGSLNMVKASWQNLMMGIAGGGDFSAYMNQFLYSIQVFANNIIPVVTQTLEGIGTAVANIFPVLIQKLTEMIIQNIPQIVNAITNMFIGVVQGIINGFKGLFSGTADEAKKTAGATITATNASKSLADQNKKTTKSFDNLTKATKSNNKENKKAKKNVKRTIADYDKLRVIQKQTTKQAAQAAKAAKPKSGGTGGTAGGGVSTGGVVPSVDDGGKKMDELSAREKRKLGMIQTVAGMFLAAIGMIILLTGHIGLGIGMIIAGIAVFKTGIANLKDSGLDQKTKDMLKTIGKISGISLVALGLILCLTGVGVPLGLGMIVAGGTALAGVAALDWDDFSGKLSGAWETIKNWWNNDVMNSEVVKGLRSFYDTNIKPIADKIDARVSKLWNETLLPFWENKVKPLWEKMKPYLEKYWNNWLWPLIKTIGQVIGELFTTLGNLLSTVVDTIANLLEDLLNMFGDAADGIEALFKGDWKKAGESGLSLMDDWNQLVADIGTGILNTLIDVVNGITGVINKFLGWIGDIIDKDWGDAIPKIPHVDRVDASKHGYRAALESAKGGGGHHSSTFSVDSVTPTINNEQTIVVELDGDVLTQKVVRSQARRTVMMGV